MALDKRIVRTRKMFTEALLELLLEKDVSDISITELAHKADLDRKTFYLHYRTVEGLLEEFYAHRAERIRQSMESVEVLDAKAFFYALDAAVAGERDVFRKLSATTSYGPMDQQVRRVLRDVLHPRILKTGRTLRETDFLASLYAAGMSEIFRQHLAGELPGDSEELTELAMKVFRDPLWKKG